MWCAFVIEHGRTIPRAPTEIDGFAGADVPVAWEGVCFFSNVFCLCVGGSVLGYNDGTGASCETGTQVEALLKEYD